MRKTTAAWRQRAYGLVVALYPRAFRDRYGAAMKQTFGDLIEDPDVPASRIWRSVFSDLRDSFLHEHLANLIGGRFMTGLYRFSGPLIWRGAVFGCAIVVTWLTFRSLHLFGGSTASPQGWQQLGEFLRLASPWLLFVPAGFVGARTAGTFGGGIWAGLVAGAIASLTVIGDYAFFHRPISGGVVGTIVTLAVAAFVAMAFAMIGAALARLRSPKAAELLTV